MVLIPYTWVLCEKCRWAILLAKLINNLTGLEGLPWITSSPTPHTPKLLNVNCQSIRGKKGAWINLLSSTKPDVIIATEMWLDQTISDSELECDGYKIYRWDRWKGMAAGDMIAVSTKITSSRVKVNAIKDSEILWTKVHCQWDKDILIAACYRPDVSDKVTYGELKNCLTKLVSSRKTPFGIVVAGDFKFPGSNCEEKNINRGSQYVGRHQDFKDILDEFGMIQHTT